MKVTLFFIIWTTLLLTAMWQYASEPVVNDKAGAAPMAKIINLQGSGYQKPSSTFMWRAAEVGATLPAKTVFATGSDSTATLALNGGLKIHLSELSQVELSEDFARQREVLTVFRGSLRVTGKVKKGYNPGQLRAGLFAAQMRLGKGAVLVEKDVNQDRVVFLVQGGATLAVARQDASGSEPVKLGLSRPKFDSKPKVQPLPSVAVSTVGPEPRRLPRHLKQSGLTRYFWRDGKTSTKLEVPLVGLLASATATWGGERLDVKDGRVEFSAPVIERSWEKTANLVVDLNGEKMAVGAYQLLNRRHLRPSGFVALAPKSGHQWVKLRADGGPYVRMVGQSAAILLSHFDIVDVSVREQQLQEGWFFLKAGKFVGEATGSLGMSAVKKVRSLTTADLIFKGKRRALMSPESITRAFLNRSEKMYFLTASFLVPVDWQLMASQPSAEGVLRQKRYFFSDRVEILPDGH